MPKLNKRQTTIQKSAEQHRAPQSLEEALKLLKSAPKVKFDQTVEIHFRLGVNPKMNDQQIR
jgi:large subunit ribosomal protein L1